MSVLDGFEVVEYKRTKYSKWKCGEVLDAFLATGNKSMGKRYDNGDELYAACNAFRSYIRSHKYPVRISGSDGMFVMTRKDAD